MLNLVAAVASIPALFILVPIYFAFIWFFIDLCSQIFYLK